MMYSLRHLPDKAVEPSSGSNVIPRRARPGLAGLAGLIAAAQSGVSEISITFSLQGYLAHKKEKKT